jgi:hypothetical protein
MPGLLLAPLQGEEQTRIARVATEGALSGSSRARPPPGAAPGPHSRLISPRNRSGRWRRRSAARVAAGDVPSRGAPRGPAKAAVPGDSARVDHSRRSVNTRAAGGFVSGVSGSDSGGRPGSPRRARRSRVRDRDDPSCERDATTARTDPPEAARPACRPRRHRRRSRLPAHARPWAAGRQASRSREDRQCPASRAATRCRSRVALVAARRAPQP